MNGRIKVNNCSNGGNTSLWKPTRDKRAKRKQQERERSAEWWRRRIELHRQLRAAQQAAAR